MDIRVDRHLTPLDVLAHLLVDASAHGAYGDALEALIDGRPEDSLSLLDQALRVLPRRGDEMRRRRTVRALLAADGGWPGPQWRGKLHRQGLDRTSRAGIDLDALLADS